MRIFYKIDECQDCNGFFTIREDDNSHNGNIDSEPIATVYTLENAETIIRLLNKINY